MADKKDCPLLIFLKEVNIIHFFVLNQTLKQLRIHKKL